MASAPRSPIRSVLSLCARLIGAAIAAVLALALLFVLTAWIGAAIPRNPGWTPPRPSEPGAVTILVGSNGVHDQIVMPYKAAGHDWRGPFPPSDARASGNATHVGVSFGEREFFIATPRWSDASPVAALRALVGGEALIHVVHLSAPGGSEQYQPVRLRAHEYRALASAIETELAPDHLRSRLPGYGAGDLFYEARQAYHLGNTCNQWTSDRLAEAGMKVGWWTPLPASVLRSVGAASR